MAPNSVWVAPTSVHALVHALRVLGHFGGGQSTGDYDHSTSHNNTIRTLERSLLAADTDGYADTESGTSHECAVRVPKGYRD